MRSHLNNEECTADYRITGATGEVNGVVEQNPLKKTELVSERGIVLWEM